MRFLLKNINNNIMYRVISRNQFFIFLHALRRWKKRIDRIIYLANVCKVVLHTKYTYCIGEKIIQKLHVSCSDFKITIKTSLYTV